MYAYVLMVAIANMMKYKVHMGQSLDRYNLHMVFTWWTQDTKAYLWSMVKSLLFKKRYTAIRVIKSSMIDFFKTGLVASSTNTQCRCRCRCRCRDRDTATTVMYAQLTAYIAAQRQTTRVSSLFFFSQTLHRYPCHHMFILCPDQLDWLAAHASHVPWVRKSKTDASGWFGPFFCQGE